MPEGPNLFESSEVAEQIDAKAEQNQPHFA